MPRPAGGKGRYMAGLDGLRAVAVLAVGIQVQLDKFHAGDKVTYSASETGGKKTITKIENE